MQNSMVFLLNAIKRFTFLLCVISFSGSFVYGEIFSQWRGPQRNGVYTETNLLKSWPEEGPQLLWSIDGLRNGYSSAAVASENIYVTGRKGDEAFLTALKLDGSFLWQVAVGSAARQSYRESRSTPTVEDNRVYLITGAGEIVCVDTDAGRILWAVDGFNKFHGDVGSWEVSESPLVVDDKVIYTPGGNETTMVALDKMTGETIWVTESLKDKTAYVSPLLIEWAGKQVIVNVTAHYLFGVDASSGYILWKTDYASLEVPTKYPQASQINTNTPVFKDGKIYVTSGYDHVGAMYQLNEQGDDIRFLWYDDSLDTHHGGVVLVDGYLYGSNWVNNSAGDWVCLNWDTGKTEYVAKWNTKGSIIYADGMLYCYDEKRGNIALVEATPEAFNIISSFRITQGRGPHWAHPVIKDGILYMRHGEFLMAYDIQGE
jgi:outer membrane protein assembly factor BamB